MIDSMFCLVLLCMRFIMRVMVLTIDFMRRLRKRWISNKLVMPFSAVIRVFNIFLHDIEAHLKDIVILECIPKALFFMLRIYVAEFLSTFRMLYSHL